MEKEISLAEQVYRQIKERITNQEYPTGMALTEAKLAEEFGVSKTPVKSAINRLTDEGWLDTGFRRKVYVKGFTEKDINEYYELRILLERAAIEKIFHTKQNWDYSFELEAALLRVKAGARDPIAMETADAAFHQKLIDVFHNEKITDIYTKLNEELLRVNILAYHYNSALDTDYIASTIRELEDFVHAVRDEDFDQAVHYMIDTHLRKGQESVLEAVQHQKEAEEEGLSADRR